MADPYPQFKPQKKGFCLFSFFPFVFLYTSFGVQSHIRSPDLKSEPYTVCGQPACFVE